MADASSHSERTLFALAAAGFAALAEAVPADGWDRPALGVWTVRELVGHTTRALTTVESYRGRRTDGPPLDGPVAYITAAAAEPSGSAGRAARDEAIAARGRESAAALGDDPAGGVAGVVERVRALVDQLADDTPMGTAAGPMTLAGYLPTRTLELTVHSLDLCRALDVAEPEGLRPAIEASLVLAARAAAAEGHGAAVLLALCGRGPLPEGFAVI